MYLSAIIIAAKFKNKYFPKKCSTKVDVYTNTYTYLYETHT
jgi:hypothetical protein